MDTMQLELAGHSISGQVVVAALAGLLVLVAVALVVRGARRRAGAAAAQTGAETRYEAGVAAYRAQVAAWHGRRAAFHTLLEVARDHSGDVAPETVALLDDDVELARLHQALLTSASGASRVELLRNVAQNLNDHELRRPLVPTVPVPVDGLGRRDRVRAAEWYVARTSETESLAAMVDQAVVMVPTQTAIRRGPAAEVAVAS